MQLDKTVLWLFFFRASIAILCYGRGPDVHSAVIAHLSLKFCLLGEVEGVWGMGGSCSAVIRKLEAKNCVGVKDKSTSAACFSLA